MQQRAKTQISSAATEELRVDMLVLTVVGAVVPIAQWVGFGIGVVGLRNHGVGAPVLAAYVAVNVIAMITFIVLAFSVGT